MAEFLQHVAENRRQWDQMAGEWADPGERQWARREPARGIWQLPESELRLLPDGMEGVRAIELGCGTGQVAASLRRRGGDRRTGGPSFNLPISGWMRLFGQVGFDVVRFLEVRAPDSASGEAFGVPADWAAQFPSERVWHLRKR